MLDPQYYLKQSPERFSGQPRAQPCLSSYILLPGNNSELSQLLALIAAWLDILTPDLFCPEETVEMIGMFSILKIGRTRFAILCLKKISSSFRGHQDQRWEIQE